MANTPKAVGSRKPLWSPKMTYWTGAHWMHQENPTRYSQQVLVLLVETPLRLLEKTEWENSHILMTINKWKTPPPPQQRSGKLRKHSAHVPQSSPPHPTPRTENKEDHVRSFTTAPYTPASTQTIALLFLLFRAPECSQQKGSLDEVTLAVPLLGELRMLSVNVHTMLALVGKIKFRDFPGGSVVKESTCRCRRHVFEPWCIEITHPSERQITGTAATEPSVPQQEKPLLNVARKKSAWQQVKPSTTKSKHLKL